MGEAVFVLSFERCCSASAMRSGGVLTPSAVWQGRAAHWGWQAGGWQSGCAGAEGEAGSFAALGEVGLLHVAGWSAPRRL